MTWKEIKDKIESLGVKDGDHIRIVDQDDNSIEDIEDLEDSIDRVSTNNWEIVI